MTVTHSYLRENLHFNKRAFLTRQRNLGWNIPSPEYIFWVLFVFGGCGSLNFIKIDDPQRLFWIAADIMAVTLTFRTPRIMEKITYNLHLMSWGVLAVLSAAWSLTPGISAYHGLQLIMTITVGICMFESLGLFRCIQVIAIALAMSLILSLLFIAAGIPSAVGSGGEWAGIFPHKNYLAEMAVIDICCAISLLYARWHIFLTSMVLILAVTLLLMTRSGTSISAFLFLLSIHALFLINRSRSRFRGVSIVSIVAILTGSIVMILVSGTNLFGTALGVLGKDETLTGRTVLWEYGVNAFYNAPWIGVGYKAYWESSLTNHADLQYVLGQDLWFFHNNFVDVAVAFGCCGLILFIYGLLKTFARALGFCLSDNGPLYMWPLAITIQCIIMSMGENVLFQNHSLMQVLLGLAAAATAGEMRRPKGLRFFKASVDVPSVYSNR